MKREERRQLREIIDGVRTWINTAEEVRHRAAHLPLSGAATLDGGASALLDAVAQASASGDLDAAIQGTKTTWFDRRKNLQPAYEAASRLSTFHREVRSTAHDERLMELRASLAERASGEREQLRVVLVELGELRAVAGQALADAAHMPLTREGVLNQPEENALRSIVEIFDMHRTAAGYLLDPNSCLAGECAHCHLSAGLLRDLHRDVCVSAGSDEFRIIAHRVSKQLRVEQEEVKGFFERALRWEDRVEQIKSLRRNARLAVESRVTEMIRDSATVNVGQAYFRLLPVVDSDVALLANLACLRQAPITPADEDLLAQVADAAKKAVPLTKRAFNSRWECSRDRACVTAHEELPGIYRNAERFERELTRLATFPNVPPIDLDQILEPAIGFLTHLPVPDRAVELVNKATTTRAQAGVSHLVDAEKTAKESASQAKLVAEKVRANDIADALKAMDLEALKRASAERIRVTALANAGMNNVWDVLKYDENRSLRELPSLGETSARSIIQAARRLFEGVRDETPVRIDVKRRRLRTTELLETLRRWDAGRQHMPTQDEVAVAKAFVTLFKSRTLPSRVLVLADDNQAFGQCSIVELLKEALERKPGEADSADIWADFLSRPADYFGMLTELGFMTEDEKRMHGDLPEEIIEAVRAKELKRDYLTASLRAYQSFGARFALVQEKVVIGDEMGLGKTVEALTVLAHLRSSGHSNFLVVCPAAVVSNWIRETSKHTKLNAWRLHGSLGERNHAIKSWIHMGGVAVTTYDLLPWAQPYLANVEVGCAVFDEAHYIKNPTAKRSVAAAEVIGSLPHSVLMTGTPLENNVQEFRNLIGYIRPDLSESAPDYLPSKFRKHVAPAYLRRNQEDVLTELPELVEIDEWMGMSDADERVYRAAVEEGQFMMMRRAAMLSEQSMKVDRLIEIVEEAEANGRRVIVFSYFREVLSEVARLLPGEVFGPLTGSTPAVERQVLIDHFSNAGGGAALVAQIAAGGVGLNIQSASVVVICEPQLKPTTESQAIARAHRMGQTNTVQVHRLLTENSVDERIREILSEKRRLFDEFARDSVIAKQAPDAVDMSDVELARVVIAAERERLFGQATPSSE